MANERVAIISNTLSSTFVFRESLVDKLANEKLLGLIISTTDDRSNVATTKRTYPIVLVGDTGLFGRMKGVLSTVRKARQEGVSIYHGFTHVGNALAALLWMVNGGTLVLTITGMGRAFSSSAPKYRIFAILILCFYSLAQFAARRVIVQNEDDRKLISRVFLPRNRGRIRRTNGSGISLQHFDEARRKMKKDDSVLCVGFFSRALPEKGVNAYYDLAKRYKGRQDIAFRHFGHAGAGRFSDHEIGTTAQQSNVEYLGFVMDPRVEILRTDIILLPSNYREGLSRLCVEAMLAGKTIIARRTAGVRDHLINGVNAFVYDNPDQLSAVFHAAIHVDRAPITINARNYAMKNFNVDCVDATYFEAYGWDIMHQLRAHPAT